MICLDPNLFNFTRPALDFIRIILLFFFGLRRELANMAHRSSN